MPLAQLVDLLPDSVWKFLIGGGLSAPAIGLAFSWMLYGPGRTRRRSFVTLLFHVVTFPLYLVARSVSSPIPGCALLLLLPVGFVMGLYSLLPPQSDESDEWISGARGGDAQSKDPRRGFAVITKPQDDAADPKSLDTRTPRG